MIVLLFKSQLRTDIDAQDYQATRARMMDLVNKIPGFVSYKTFRADDGETLAIARFTSEECATTGGRARRGAAAERRRIWPM